MRTYLERAREGDPLPARSITDREEEVLKLTHYAIRAGLIEP